MAERSHEPDDEEHEESDEGESELDDVEVERAPDLAGFELYKANDLAEGRERWVIALRYDDASRAIEYAFWSDPRAEDADSTGTLDSSSRREPWARAVHDAVAASDQRTLDDTAREELLFAIIERCDRSFDYEDRLVFAIGPHDDAEGGEEDEDFEADDEDDDDEASEDDD